MSCSCIYVDTDTLAEFHSEKIQIARKQHKCCECGDIINPGEKYEYVCGCWEGDFSVYKTCEDCQNIRNEFFCEGWNYGFILGDLYEYIAQEGGQVSEDCLLELSAEAREKVFEIIEEIWEDKSVA